MFTNPNPVFLGSILQNPGVIIAQYFPSLPTLIELRLTFLCLTFRFLLDTLVERNKHLKTKAGIKIYHVIYTKVL